MSRYVNKTGRKLTEAHKKKLRAWHRGKVLSEEHKRNIAKAGIGKRNGLKKGYYIDAHGYKILREINTDIKEHRLVVEKFIGRALESKEFVHHIDGNPLNNDISNLQIMSNSEHMKLHRSKNAKTF